MTERPAPSGIDVLCKLQHFAIITYAFDPARFAGVMPPRFRLDTVRIDGEERALLSVVPFIDVDFTSAVFPFPKFRMGQTNYRIYIVDTQTGERCVWFIGTTLDSWTRVVPHGIWNLPWYGGKVRFDCEQDADGLYTRYRMHTRAQWAPAEVSLVVIDAGTLLAGFPIRKRGWSASPIRFAVTPPARWPPGTYHVWHARWRSPPRACCMRISACSIAWGWSRARNSNIPTACWSSRSTIHDLPAATRAGLTPGT